MIHKVKDILALGKVYDIAISLIAKHDTRSHLALVINATSGDRVLDIGCGTASVLKYLPNVSYLGIDFSPKYIARAKKQYGERGDFRCVSVDELSVESSERFDRILLLGVIHHLNNEQVESLMKVIDGLLVETGQLITHDPVFVNGQSKIAKFFLKNDRGSFVRYEQEYVELIESSMKIVEHRIETKLLRIPYSILFTTSEKR
jgi:cyclopropane fatty-acyl-phospholipid synthase-like methyltransferase